MSKKTSKTQKGYKKNPPDIFGGTQIFERKFTLQHQLLL
jgi:hypothetical protein